VLADIGELCCCCCCCYCFSALIGVCI